MLFHFGLTECSASPSKAAPTVATKEAFYVLRWDRGLGSVQPESTQTQAALGSAEASRKRRVCWRVEFRGRARERERPERAEPGHLLQG